MDETTLVDAVKRAGRTGTRDAAEAAIGATLRAFGERVSHGPADSIAERLPDAFSGYVRTGSNEPADFPVDEFYRRVRDYAREDGLDADEASIQRYVNAVVGALADDPEVRHELRDAREQLPEEYETIFRGVDLDDPS